MSNYWGNLVSYVVVVVIFFFLIFDMCILNQVSREAMLILLKRTIQQISYWYDYLLTEWICFFLNIGIALLYVISTNLRLVCCHHWTLIWQWPERHPIWWFCHCSLLMPNVEYRDWPGHDGSSPMTISLLQHLLCVCPTLGSPVKKLFLIIAC